MKSVKIVFSNGKECFVEYLHNILTEEELQLFDQNKQNLLTIHVKCENLSASFSPNQHYENLLLDDACKDISSAVSSNSSSNYLVKFNSGCEKIKNLFNKGDTQLIKFNLLNTKHSPKRSCTRRVSIDDIRCVAINSELFFCVGEAIRLKSIYEKFFPFLLFFIETASMIDINDERWKCLIIFRQTLDGQSVLNVPIGICTFYQFVGIEKCRVRLSQFLVLPCYQKAGYGKLLYEQVYKHVCNQMLNVDEFTVEDGNDLFCNLRDGCDAEMLLGIKSHDKLTSIFYCSSHEVISQLSKKTKLPIKQLEKALEIIAFPIDSRQTSPQNQDKIEQIQKQYRLHVKKRIYKEKLEEFDGMPVDERKRLLDELYEKRSCYCRRVLQKIGC